MLFGFRGGYFTNPRSPPFVFIAVWRQVALSPMRCDDAHKFLCVMSLWLYYYYLIHEITNSMYWLSIRVYTHNYGICKPSLSLHVVMLDRVPLSPLDWIDGSRDWG
jgi:hypothetical protein